MATAKELVAKYEAAMEDDFNTADAIAAIFELVKLSNSTVSEKSSKTYAGSLKEMLEKLCGVLGIVTCRKEEALDEEVEALIAERFCQGRPYPPKASGHGDPFGGYQGGR